MFEVPLMVTRAESIASGAWAPVITPRATYIAKATAEIGSARTADRVL